MTTIVTHCVRPSLYYLINLKHDEGETDVDLCCHNYLAQLLCSFTLYHRKVVDTVIYT